ncbi:hypothetical protein GO755_32880 [Spirosoma sp. HMF4905]|uniref:Uncharacterized protein n=1 Tax=Spirosoma arboris TaxID=2682092 RepID=A0A7K1SM37_9BACT|nr:hypothetical protein [Spirosoma arboris]MVM34870.1 hypothetical protein [Spirosoma arboris]
MDTLENAIAFLRHNDTPFWWLFSGNSKVGMNVKEEDINASIDLLRKSVEFLPNGSYKLECSANKNDRSGSFKFPFTKGQISTTRAATMSTNSMNPGGLSDEHLRRIRDEERFKLKVENLVDKMERFFEEWPDYKKKIDRLLTDDDDDGIPDILEMTRKVTDVAKAGKEMKGLFS